MRRALVCLLTLAAFVSGASRVAQARAAAKRIVPLKKENPRHFQWRYRRAKRSVEKQRLKLAKAYRSATTPAARANVIARARKRLVRLIDRKLFPFWYSTPWNIRGATRRPRTGSIACGTFVSTVLHHAGLRVERDRLGAQNSPQLMKSLTTNKYLKLTYRWSIQRFVKRVRKMGRGLYIVGLDMHVGFLLVRSGRVYFVHSSYGSPAVVLKERALKSPILTASRWRLVGRISQDPALILKWLLGTKIPTFRRKKRTRRRTGLPNPPEKSVDPGSDIRGGQ